jgi:hypothetical protein
MAVHHDVANEHVEGAHPQTGFTIQRSVYDQWFKGFAVARHAHDLVVQAFVMPIATRLDRWQFRQGLGLDRWNVAHPLIIPSPSDGPYLAKDMV